MRVLKILGMLLVLLAGLAGPYQLAPSPGFSAYGDPESSTDDAGAATPDGLCYYQQKRILEIVAAAVLVQKNQADGGSLKMFPAGRAARPCVRRSFCISLMPRAPSLV